MISKKSVVLIVGLFVLAGCGTPAAPTTAPVVEPAATVVEPTVMTEAATEAPAEATAESTAAATTEAAATEAMTTTEAMTGTGEMTGTMAMTDTSAMTGTMTSEMDIVDMAENAGTFKTLIAALTAGDLVETLRGEGPFTVFAPSDEAFAKLPKATLDDLLLPANKEKLIRVLTYHVVPGRVLAADVAKLTSAKSLEGGDLAVKVDGSTVTINDATVTSTDIATKNGVIHVIDTVLLPPDLN